MTAILDKKENWLEKIQRGMLDVSDLETLNQVSMEEMLARLRPLYPVSFLESNIRSKWEFGLAQSSRFLRRSKDKARDESGALQARHLSRCLLLTFEGGRLKTIASMPSLRIRPSTKVPGSWEVHSSSGFSLFRDLDGWSIKLLEDKTVTLTEEFLKKRGWRGED